MLTRVPSAESVVPTSPYGASLAAPRSAEPPMTRRNHNHNWDAAVVVNEIQLHRQSLRAAADTEVCRRSVASNIVPNNYRDSIGDDEYVARVRRYAPSSLVPLVATAAAQYATPGSWEKSPWMKFTPWALADIARVSLISGNEFKSAATVDDLLRCCAAYVAVNDPELASNAPGSLTGFMLRITSEQLSYEQSPFHVMGRTMALFEQTQPAPGKALKVLRPGWDTELLGCSLSQYV